MNGPRVLLLPLLCLLSAAPVLAAPPEIQRYSALEALSLPAAGTPGGLFAPRLLVWPQLDRREDQLWLLVPGEPDRLIHQCEPNYVLGTLYGVAEGDWAVFTEVPAQRTTTLPLRLVAIFLPRGSKYSWPLPGPLDNRYAYAPRLFGFPDQPGETFHWLALPPGGTPGFGTIDPRRNIAQLSVDGPRLVAKTIDPKNFRGTSSIAYYFYGIGRSTDGMPQLTELASRTFPHHPDAPYYDAEEVFWHPEYTVLAGRERRADQPFVAIAPLGEGMKAKGITGRILGYRHGQLAFLTPADQITVVDIELPAGRAEVVLKKRWERPLAQAATVGKVVWITGAWVAGSQIVLQLQVHLAGQQYAVSQLGSDVLAVWDMSQAQPVLQLTGQAVR